ncbi:DUF3093 domain-containing protein [Tsukamurella sp. 8F]|uniref:DUF3093 domain-containing protein n=1 Tax=unclassified Tsukamurella TaxID=2633480 RepID=UPI0023B97254|nr:MULTISPECIES: DUF3093 domain-containing protein [unclassified Tsukamurella]MDF0531302.1 DUF3093 domain-containing protein [Tsukamurella sp. 8J]MDF0585251.1 DUF3093 domain-containing protein [Tsukamurella sp. 8F]
MDSTYRERLYVPWQWWPAAAIAVALIGYEVQIAARGSAWVWAVYAVLGALAAVLLFSMGRAQVQVRDGEVWAGDAHLPVELISRAAAVPASAKSAALGRQLDPAAYLFHRSWVKTLVVLVLDDPDDPTPYWMVSTRHPDRVLAHIPTATALS